MKNFFLKILRLKLRWLARLTIYRYRPGVIGVTGSVGKTSAKLAIAAVLGTERKVRFASGNFNNELGLPLTIIGPWEKIGGIFFWIKVFFSGTWRLIFKSADYPEILVLEYAIDRPGDMDYLLSIAEPNVAVVTAIGDVPVHVEFFGGPEGVAAEKGKIVQSLPAGGAAILNYDDEIVMAIKGRTKAETTTFGFEEGADIRIVNFKNKITDGRPDGISFRLDYKGQPLQVDIPGAFGRAQAYAAASAAAVGLIFGVNFLNISEALRGYKPAPHRMNLLEGIRGSMIIDDSYNASPLSMDAALHALKDLPGKRKIAVLGDMLEIGKYTIQAHEKIGQIAGRVADTIVTVGPRAKFIAEGVRKTGARKVVMEFDTWEDAREPVQELIKRDDLVLVKASRAVKLDKVVEVIKETAPSSSG